MKNRIENSLSNQDLKNQLNIMDTHDTISDLEKISIPTLIIGGTKDRIIPFTNSELLNEKIPNSTLKTFNGLEHLMVTEAAEQVNEDIWNFIQQNS